MPDSPDHIKGNFKLNQHDEGNSTVWRERLTIYGMALLFGLVIGLYALVAAKHSGGDFATLYLSDARYKHEQSIYWMAPEFEPASKACPEGAKGFDHSHLKGLSSEELVRLPPCIHPNLNPPFFILLTAPLAYLGFEAAWGVWFFLSLICLFSAVRLMQRQELIAPGLAAFGWVSLGFLLYFPTVASFFLGQVTFLVMLPMLLGWVALRQQRNGTAGAWLGLAASLKPFVGLIWLGLTLQKNGRAAGAMLLTGFVCAVIGLLPGGWDAYIDYSAALHAINWQAASWNASLAGFISRPLGGSQNIPWIDAPGWARGLTTLATLATLALYVRAVRQCNSLTVRARSDWLLALSLPAMLLVSPLGWLYYFPLMVFTVLVLWRSSGGMAHPNAFRWALAATLALSTIPSWLIPAKQMNDPIDWFGPTGFYTVVLVQFLVLAALSVSHASRSPPKHYGPGP
jgi:hypothetical protein